MREEWSTLSQSDTEQDSPANGGTEQELDRRLDLFMTFTRLLQWIDVLAVVAIGTVAFVGSVSLLYVVGFISLTLYPVTVLSRRMARAGRLRLGVYMIAGALYVVLLPMTLIAVGAVPVVLLALILPVLLVGLFVSPRLVLRMTVVTAGVALVSLVLEQWAPFPRVDASALVLFIAPLAILLVGVLVYQFGQTLLRALEASQSYASELERSRAELLERSREVQTTASALSQRSQELEVANVQLEEARRRQETVNRELQEANARTRRRAAQLAAVAEVGRAIAQVRDPERLLSEVTGLISRHFGYYHVGIFLVDQAARYAVLRAANSEGGQRMLDRSHRLLVGQGVVGYAVATGEPRIALDVGADPAHFDNPNLPDTRSEMALPLRLGDQTVGALDVQSIETGAFDSEDVSALSVLADQVATAIENARLFQQSQGSLAEAQELQRRYLEGAWQAYVRGRSDLRFEYALDGVPSALDVELPATQQATMQGELVAVSDLEVGDDDDAVAQAVLSVPIKLRGQVLGVIELHEADEAHVWTEHEVTLAQAVADQMAQALESQRLFEQTQARARREALTRQITERIRDAMDVDAMLQTAARELGQALDAPKVYVRLATDAGERGEGVTPVPPSPDRLEAEQRGE